MVTYKHETKTGGQPKQPRHGHVSLTVVLLLGIVGSFFFSRPLEENAFQSWEAQATTDAQRLTRTFM